jgi:acyl-CoA synthetase (AMP-forming)/AMP-acid ligase II
MPLTWPDPPLPDEVLAGLVGPGAPFELVDEDVLGARMPVFARRPASLVEVLRIGAERFGERPYLVFPERTVSFAEALAAAGVVAANLQRNHGVGKGDRVAIASANCLGYALGFWAVTMLGAITVALNGWWTGPEMAYALELTTPTVLLGDQARLERLADAPLGGLEVVRFESDFAALEEPAPPAPVAEMGEDDPYLILFTSGTTGRPKGVMVTHRNTVHFGLAMQLRGAEGRARAALAGQPVGETPVPCAINASPMFHVSGLNCTMALGPLNGQTYVYPPPGRWQEEVHLRLTEQHRATQWSLVPTQLWRLLDWPDLGRYDLTSLNQIGGGSAVWPPELLKRLEQRLPWVRPRLGMGYGMTETNGIGTSLGGQDSYLHPDSIGRPAPTVQVEIRDPATRAPLGEGVVGELALRSACNFLGYWDNPDATAAVLDADRWYHTGDLGLHRDGVVYLEGRRQDLIIRGGENVYPVEIENRLYEHPGVAEAAVVGVDHPTLGQEVKAYVVAKDGAAVDPEALRRFCAEALAGFKVPAHVELVAALPHNAAGKVLKHLLGRPEAASDFVEE